MCIILAWVQSYYADSLLCLRNRATGEEWCIYHGGVYLNANPWSVRPPSAQPPPHFECFGELPESFVPRSLSMHLGVILFFVVLFPYVVKLSIQAYRGRLRAGRRRKGLCERCSYDLRGTTSLQCSECGHEITPKMETRAIGHKA